MGDGRGGGREDGRGRSGGWPRGRSTEPPTRPTQIDNTPARGGIAMWPVVWRVANFTLTILPTVPLAIPPTVLPNIHPTIPQNSCTQTNHSSNCQGNREVQQSARSDGLWIRVIALGALGQRQRAKQRRNNISTPRTPRRGRASLHRCMLMRAEASHVSQSDSMCCALPLETENKKNIKHLRTLINTYGHLHNHL